MKTTLIQFVMIGLAALIVGFSANAMRGKSALHISKNYFDMGGDLVEIAKQRASESATISADTPVVETADGFGAAQHALTNAPESDSTAAQQSSGGGHLEHPYQTIMFDDIVAVLDDPLTQAGLNILIDARNEQSYEEGHIPGAWLCNPYQVANYLDRDMGGMTMLDGVLAAEKVVVYCGGGECADSIFMSRELLELDVPYSAIFLYEGGWNDWIAHGGAIEKGTD